jgi:hypothetical protein
MRVFALLLLGLPLLQGATLSGVVKDPSGAAVARAEAIVVGASLAEPIHAFTDTQGRFRFDDLAPGPYLLNVVHESFEPYEHGVTIGDKPVDVAVALKVRRVVTSVDVSAKRSPLRNSDPNYQALRGGKLRQAYRVRDLVLTRDAATFTFHQGSFSFPPPVLDRVAIGVFVGEGTFQLKPAFEVAARHLRQMSGADSVTEDFTALVIYFSDATFDEIERNAELTDEPLAAHEQALKRVQENTRDRYDTPGTFLDQLLKSEDVPNIEAEMLGELYNPAERGSFRAFIHGRKHSGLLYIVNPQGALPTLPAPDETALIDVSVSSFAEGIWYLSHLASEIQAGQASSNEDKRLIEAEHYRMQVSIGGNQRLASVCELRFKALRSGTRVVKFDLLPDLEVSRVSVEGHEIPYIQESRKQNGSFYVTLPEALVKDRVYQAVFEYQGDQIIRNFGGRVFAIKPRLAWYPRTGPTTRATYDITFLAPRGLTVAGVGDLVKQWREGSSEAFQWTSDKPLPAAGFNYGDFKKTERTDEVLYYPLAAYLSESARGLLLPSSQIALTTAQNALRCFEYWFGPTPFPHLAISEATAYDSLPGLVYIPGYVLTDRGQRYVATEGSSRIMRVNPILDESLPREVARQWWGNLAAPASTHDEWLTRGFADFAVAMYDRATESAPDSFLDHWRRARDFLLLDGDFSIRLNDAGPVWLGMALDSLITSRGGIVKLPRPPFSSRVPPFLNAKGGFIIHMLRGLMYDPVTGDKDFLAMVRDFLSTFGNGTVSTEQFKFIVDKHIKPAMDLGRNGRMDWFFNEWVFGTDFPSYRLEYSIATEPGGKRRMKGRLTQSGVSERFRMRVPIYGKLPGKNRETLLGAMTLTGNTTGEFQSPLPKDVQHVVLNPNYDVLARRVEMKEIGEPR